MISFRRRIIHRRCYYIIYIFINNRKLVIFLSICLFVCLFVPSSACLLAWLIGCFNILYISRFTRKKKFKLNKNLFPHRIMLLCRQWKWPVLWSQRQQRQQVLYWIQNHYWSIFENKSHTYTYTHTNSLLSHLLFLGIILFFFLFWSFVFLVLVALLHKYWIYSMIFISIYLKNFIFEKNKNKNLFKKLVRKKKSLI